MSMVASVERDSLNAASGRFAFSYSPVRGRGGGIEGVMDIAVETTRQVVDRRRLETVIRLRDALDKAERADEVPLLAGSALRSDPEDFAAVEIVPAGSPVRAKQTGSRLASAVNGRSWSRGPECWSRRRCSSVFCGWLWP